MHKPLILFFLIVFLVSCSAPTKYEKLFTYSKQESKHCIVYSQYPIDSSLLNDFDLIYSNLAQYLGYVLPITIDSSEKVIVGILPIDNTVCSFEKHKTSTFSYPKRNTMYLLDINHLPKELLLKYGNPPKDFYQNAFSHELTHIFTVGKMKFSKKTEMQERLANYCSFINFNKTPFNANELQIDLHNLIHNNFTTNQINKIEKNGLNQLDSKDSYEIPIFMIYLNQDNGIGNLQRFINAKSINDFINKSNWNSTDTEKFVNWLKSN